MAGVSDYVEAAVELLGGEDAEFYLTAGEDTRFQPSRFVVTLNCRYGDCEWGESVGQIEMWEFAADARSHWETEHAA
jgi:hypothetical protein